MDGLTLSRAFYHDAARQVIESVVSPGDYAAGLFGWSSEVLGYDDAVSRDHNWGPRLIVLLRRGMGAGVLEALDRRLREELPREFLGFPTNFGPTLRGDQRVMSAIAGGPVDHFVQIDFLEHYLASFLGIDVNRELTADEWLAIPEQKLLGFTRGEVFHDGPGDLTRWRQRLAFYPDGVWYRGMARIWRELAEEEAFVGRCAARGDTLGELLVTGRIVEHLMRLVVLMARTYPPYSKWFGTAFSRLPSAGELEPHLLAAIQAPDAVGREQALSRAYAFVAHTHNRLGITAPLPEGVSPAYEGRPGLVIHANRFADALNQLVEPGQG